jgi:hypothetical protein
MSARLALEEPKAVIGASRPWPDAIAGLRGVGCGRSMLIRRGAAGMMTLI